MMQTRFVAITLSLLVLSSCSPIVQAPVHTETSQPAVTPIFTKAAESPVQENVPTTTPFMDMCNQTTDLTLYLSDSYCLLYPAEDIVIPPYLIVVNPNGMPGDMPGDAWMQIRVEPISSLTVAQAADIWISEAGEGFNITQAKILVDGRRAVVVDGLPGPDPWRLVFIDGIDHLYTLFFLPWLPDADYFPQLEKLYETVISSFHALPPITNASPLPDLVINSASVSMVDENGTCLPYYALTVSVVNQGNASASDVCLAETNTRQQVGMGTIHARQSVTMTFFAKALNGAYTVIVDPQNTIAESNENNNNAVNAEPTVTPPASCLPAQLGNNTFTPTPTPFPGGDLIGYYYFVSADSPIPPGGVVIFPDMYILAPAKLDRALSPDLAGDLTVALYAVISDPRNLWVSNELKIAEITFDAGRVHVFLQGEIYGVGDVTLIAARMQILMTIFANPFVQSATVIFNGDTIGNWGVSNSINAKPADYVFTRAEVEAFITENLFTTP